MVPTLWEFPAMYLSASSLLCEIDDPIVTAKRQPCVNCIGCTVPPTPTAPRMCSIRLSTSTWEFEWGIYGICSHWEQELKSGHGGGEVMGSRSEPKFWVLEGSRSDVVWSARRKGRESSKWLRVQNIELSRSMAYKDGHVIARWVNGRPREWGYKMVRGISKVWLFSFSEFLQMCTL